MKNTFKVLILDDVKIIGDAIEKRIFKANASNYRTSNIKIIPHYLFVDHTNREKAARKIASVIALERIDILILDRGFSTLIDPSENKKYEHLDEGKLYSHKDSGSEDIEDIIRLIPQKNLDKIEGVIIYTYDGSPYSEPEQIKHLYKEILPKQISSEYIEVVLPKQEVYDLANLKLYNFEKVQNHAELESFGRKSDFMLYGLFMGEILYHRTLNLIQ